MLYQSQVVRINGQGGQEKSFAYAYDRTSVAVGTDEYAHRIIQRLALIEIIEDSLSPSGFRGCRGEHTHPVELQSSHVVDLHLQILELTVVVLRIGVVLHHVVAQTLQLNHPVENFARRSQNSVLNFEK